MSAFSERNNLSSAEAPITIRHDAPIALRQAIWAFAQQVYVNPLSLAEIINREIPNPNFNPRLPVVLLAEQAFHLCDWFKVYDIAERIYGYLAQSNARADASIFESHLNSFFRSQGIGWQMVDGEIEVRGEESIEQVIHGAITTLGNTTAGNELHEAIRDLSRRPEPDITGAMQHSGAAIECLARDLANSTDTLGSIIANHPTLFPPPLDDACKKIWGYVSEQGRHLREGRVPSFNEAMLVVGLIAALSTYLTNENP